MIIETALEREEAAGPHSSCLSEIHGHTIATPEPDMVTAHCCSAGHGASVKK